MLAFVSHRYRHFKTIDLARLLCIIWRPVRRSKPDIYNATATL